MSPEVFLIAGTRPEAIKLAPVAAAMRAAGRLTPVLVASGQHPAMVTQALDAFDVQADVTLPLQRVTGSQPELLTEMIKQLDALLEERKPAAVVESAYLLDSALGGGGVPGLMRAADTIVLNGDTFDILSFSTQASDWDNHSGLRDRLLNGWKLP